MDFPDFNNQNENHDEIHVESMTETNDYNNIPAYANNVGGSHMEAGWNNFAQQNYNDFPNAFDEAEEKRINDRREEENERRGRIVKLMNDEMRIKQELRDKAREYLDNFEQQRRSAIENRMRINKTNEEEIVNSRSNMKDNKTNPWDRVVENIEVKESTYKGTNDVSRMRSVILSRKNDFLQMKMK